MYSKVLVDQDVRNGGMLIETLHQRMPIEAAFWLNLEEKEWRLLIISPLVASGKARQAYHLVAQALAETQVPIPFDHVSVLSPTGLRYKEVRLASQGVPSGVMLAHGFGGTGVAGDAYVYVMN